MTYRGFLTRAEIGLRSPRSRSRNIDASHGGVLSHWGGPAVGIDSHSECLSTWRRWQRYHMDTKGWVDIAYTMGVCDHGYILAGRGANVRTAANGTNFANSHYYAICWIGGQGETPTADAIDAFWEARRMLRRDGRAGDEVGKHSDFRATSCSGSFGSAIDNSSPSTSSGGSSSNTTTREDTDVLKRGDNGDGVAAYQRRLLQWIEQSGRSGDPYDDFVGYGDDGDFGPTTEKTVKEFQRAYDLDATGVIGAATAGILAMYAVNPAGGGGGDHDHPFAAAGHNHDGRYALASDYNDHTHDEGTTGGPR